MLLQTNWGVLYEDDDHLPVHSADQHLISEAHSSPELEAGVCHFSDQTTTLQFTHRGQLSYIPEQKLLAQGFYQKIFIKSGYIILPSNL